MSLTSIMLDLGTVSDIAERREHSDRISFYYEQRLKELGSLKAQQESRYYKKPEYLRNCYNTWFFDYYKVQNVMDLKSISLCKDRFCTNCAKLKQATRLYKFSPVLDKIAQEYDLYHVVFTVPNMIGSELGISIDKMFNAFKYIIRCFKGNLKMAGVDFEQYGYAGAFRALEITFNKDKYHPHLHCIFALERDLTLDKVHTNDYSYDRKVFKRKFSDLEILLQKIWFLRVNDERVTQKAIESLNIGYSCIMDKINMAEKKYYEVFKYATKLYSEKSDGVKGSFITYEQFKTLDEVLHKRRTIQGYGCMYGIVADEDIDESMNAVYKQIIKELRSIELPILSAVNIVELMADLCTDSSKLRYITRRNIDSFLRERNIEPESLFYEAKLSPGRRAMLEDNVKNYKGDVARSKRKHSKDLWDKANIVFNGTWLDKWHLREEETNLRDLELKLKRRAERGD